MNIFDTLTTWFWSLFSSRAILALLLALLGIGCGETSGERIQMMDKAIEVMERHNVAYTGSVTIGGRPSVGASTDFYLNSDFTAQLSIQGNSANARLTPGPMPRNETTGSMTEVTSTTN